MSIRTVFHDSVLGNVIYSDECGETYPDDMFKDSPYPISPRFDSPLMNRLARIPVLGIFIGIARCLLAIIHIIIHLVKVIFSLNSWSEVSNSLHALKGCCEVLNGILQAIPIFGRFYAWKNISDVKLGIADYSKVTGSFFLLKLTHNYKVDYIDACLAKEGKVTEQWKWEDEYKIKHANLNKKKLEANFRVIKCTELSENEKAFAQKATHKISSQMDSYDYQVIANRMGIETWNATTFRALRISAERIHLYAIARVRDLSFFICLKTDFITIRQKHLSYIRNEGDFAVDFQLPAVITNLVSRYLLDGTPESKLEHAELVNQLCHDRKNEVFSNYALDFGISTQDIQEAHNVPRLLSSAVTELNDLIGWGLGLGFWQVKWSSDKDFGNYLNLLENKSVSEKLGLIKVWFTINTEYLVQDKLNIVFCINPVSSVPNEVLTPLRKVHCLNLYCTELTNLDFLTQLEDLELLDIRGSLKIESLIVLIGLRKLYYLVISPEHEVFHAEALDILRKKHVLILVKSNSPFNRRVLRDGFEDEEIEFIDDGLKPTITKASVVNPRDKRTYKVRSIYNSDIPDNSSVFIYPKTAYDYFNHKSRNNQDEANYIIQ